MKHALLVSILTAVLVAGAAAIYAGPPISGTYKSTNGDFDEGTASSNWNSSLVSTNYVDAGHTIVGQSYAGGGFTNDWLILCPTSASVVPLNGPLGANGNYSFVITYSGGYLYLGGPGNPWNGGDAQYTGNISTYVEIRTVQMANGKIVGAVSDHAIGASIQGYAESCVEWAIGNGVLRGGLSAVPAFDYNVLQSSKPANYPDFRFSNCVPGSDGVGHWEDIKDLTLTIHGCTVKTEQSSWGSVKAMYRD